MPAKKPDPRERMDIRSGPCGLTFFETVANVAQSKGTTASDYIRQAVLAQMRKDGKPFVPLDKSGRGESN